MSLVRLLTELDAILDTRLSVVMQLDDEASVRLISNPAYYERAQDLMEPLCGIDEARYQAAWLARDKSALMGAMVCNSLDLVNYAMREIEHRSITDPETDGAALDVNVYPYKLTDEEKRMYALSIAELVGYKCQVRMIDEPWGALTPAVIRERYAGMILYNYAEWMGAVSEKLFVLGIPRVTMVAPMLVKELPTEARLAELSEQAKTAMTPWRIGTYSVIQYVGLEYVETCHFCTVQGFALLADSPMPPLPKYKTRDEIRKEVQAEMDAGRQDA